MPGNGKMGFDDKWIQMIFGCISSISYFILVHGNPQGDIKPTRGLRHKDPLSSYLFLLVSEGLNGLIYQSVTASDIKGFSLCRNSPRYLIYFLRIIFSFFVEWS